MAIIITADSQSELPEALREKAKQNEAGKWIVDALPDGFAVENVQGLRSSLGAERGVNKLLRDKLNAFGWKLAEDGQRWTSEGLDASAAAKALEQLESGSLKSSKEIEDYKAELARKSEAQIKEVTGDRDGLRNELHSVLLDQQALAAIAEAKGSPRLLMPIIRQMGKVEKSAEGKHRVVLYDDLGRQRFSQKADANGAAMTIAELLEEMRGSQDFKAAFESTAAGGAGSTSQGGGSARAVHDTNNLSGAALLGLANKNKK